MKTSKKATSIIEAMVVMLIIITWVVWMYNIYFSSQRLSDTTKNRVQAIEIAREGLEAMKNIRDTNWLLFWADKDNCWNVLNYNPDCVWADWNDITAWSYTISPDSNNRWGLESKSNRANIWDYSDSDYRKNFQVYKDNNWFYTQESWETVSPLFTREIKIRYPSWDSNSDKMKVTSLVSWADSSSSNVHKVEFDLDLSNWEN